MNLEKIIKKELLAKKSLVKRPARGFINYDYLVPGGPYEEQWDWDGFFIGMSLACEISSEAIYLKNWCLNYLDNVCKDGFTPGLITPNGVDKRLQHIKPFLAQGAYFAGSFLKDFTWITPYWGKLKKSVLYREKKYFDQKTGLIAWYDSMESGADNNVALLGYPKGSVLSVDLNTFMYREYQALSLIAKLLGLREDVKKNIQKAEKLKNSILKYFWHSDKQSFYNLNLNSGKLIERDTYSNFFPLWSKMLPLKEGRSIIRRYLLNTSKMKAVHGIRTLAYDDPDYNQKNIIKPHSNWQGPVWPIANYVYLHILFNYGFKEDARWLARETVKLCLADIKKTGGMHENYNADTGEPLAAPDFVSWNLLVGQMIEQAEKGNNPLKLK